jgi:hypothetical protein
MNRQKFLEMPVVIGFLQYLGQRLATWHVDYVSSNARIAEEYRRFHITGVDEAVAHYAWPARFTAPAAGHGYAAGNDVEVCTWEESQNALDYLSAGLQEAIAADPPQDAVTKIWANEILRWGLGGRAGRVVAMLPGLPRGASAYLVEKRNFLQLNRIDTDSITAETLPVMNSGLSKLHSLASPDGLCIFDSRVAAAIGLCINSYVRQVGGDHVPPELLLMRSSEDRRVPPPVGPDGRNHPLFTRDYRWMRAQVRASWLIAEVLDQNPPIFHGDADPLRQRKLEAAFFMIGATLQGVQRLEGPA